MCDGSGQARPERSPLTGPRGEGRAMVTVLPPDNTWQAVGAARIRFRRNGDHALSRRPRRPQRRVWGKAHTTAPGPQRTGLSSRGAPPGPEPAPRPPRLERSSVAGSAANTGWFFGPTGQVPNTGITGKQGCGVLRANGCRCRLGRMGRVLPERRVLARGPGRRLPARDGNRLAALLGLWVKGPPSSVPDALGCIRTAAPAVGVREPTNERRAGVTGWPPARCDRTTPRSTESLGYLQRELSIGLKHPTGSSVCCTPTSSR